MKSSISSSMLQDLPAEIRLNIYGNLGPTSNSCTTDWKGLLLTCKLFHHEMKHELLRNTTRYLNNLKAEWTKTHNVPLKISTPSTISEISTVSVAIPNSYFRALDAKFPAMRLFPATFISLLQLGISRLDVTRYENDESIKKTNSATVIDDSMVGSMAVFMHDLIDAMDPSERSRPIKLDCGRGWTFSPGSYIKAIAFEWGTFKSGLDRDEDAILPYLATEQASDRTMELIRHHICGPAAGAVWRRREYTWYGQEVESFWAEARL